MASGIDVKMGVSGVSQFKSAMNQSSQSVKTLDAALKLNEKQLQATGDKEAYMTQKSKLLQQQIAAQSNVVKQGQAALQAMERNGVDPASAAYQKLQQQVLNAQTALLGMQTDLSAVGQTAGETAQQTDKLTNSLNSINKKVNFDAVLNGIGKITSSMEAAAKKVSSMATDVWNTMLTAASWADDLGTQATMYDVDVEKLQKMKRVALEIQTPVDAIFTAKQKIEKNMHDMTDASMEAFEALGLVVTGKFGEKSLDMSKLTAGETGFDQIFEIGDRLTLLDDEILRDVFAQQLMGKSWREMMPLIKAGKEAYLEAYNAQDVVTEENVEKLAELNKAVAGLKEEYETLKRTVLAQFAEPLTKAADSLAGVLQKVNEYLETPEGKDKLEALGKAAEKLFNGIININADDALDTAKGWLDGITSALTWIGDNKDTVVTAIKAIGGAFLGLKLAEVVGSLAQGAAALKSLLGGGAASAAGQGAAAAGGTLLGKAVKGAGKFIGSTAGAVAAGVLSANWIQYGDPLQFYAISGNDDIYDQNDPAFQAEQALFRKAVASNEKAQAQGRARTEAEWIRMEEAREKAWYNEQAQKMAAGLIEEMDQQFQDWSSTWEKSPYEILGAAGWNTAGGLANESPEDKLARIFGFSNDQEIVDAYSKFMKSTAGQNPYEMFGITVDDYRLFGKMAAEAQQRLKVPAEPEFSPNVAQELQDQLSGVELHVTVVPDIVGTGYYSDDGEEDVAFGHANGLPFVPFDGYIAALHRGERVLTANQNRSYTTNSNVYFDHVNVGGGVDADGLAARIAERTRRAMSGFGG